MNGLTHGMIIAWVAGIAAPLDRLGCFAAGAGFDASPL